MDSIISFIVLFIILIISSILNDKYNIDHFWAFIISSLGMAIIALLILYIRYYLPEWWLDKKRKKCDVIKNKYHNAYIFFCTKNMIKLYGDISKKDISLILSIPESEWEKQENDYLEAIRIAKEKDEKANQIKTENPHGFDIWKRDKIHYLSSDIITSEYEISKLEYDYTISELLANWEMNQSSFNNICIKLAKLKLAYFGRYSYNICWREINLYDIPYWGVYTVLQLFNSSLCLEENLDYTNLQSIKWNFNNLTKFKESALYFKSEVYENILSYIKAIEDNFNNSVLVILNDDIEGWSQEVLHFHYKYISEQLQANNIDFEYIKNITQGTFNINKNKKIILLDIFTENSTLKKYCIKIIRHSGINTNILYISMLKCYDRAEIIELIDKENKRIIKEQEKREAEEKRIRTEEEAKHSLIYKVSDWNMLAGRLHYYYLLRYYPTTCNFEATDEEWEDRWTVWNFKNTPGKTSPTTHKIVLEDIVSRIKLKLIDTFGENNLKYLTLVCIPASSQEKNECRYKEFSQQLCSETGMINSYDKINVTAERIAKHLGGSSSSMSNISFDTEFFKDKYVIIFDDIITKGNSMLSFKSKMEQMGAFVICGIAIGKTTHQRP